MLSFVQSNVVERFAEQYDRLWKEIRSCLSTHVVFPVPLTFTQKIRALPRDPRFQCYFDGDPIYFKRCLLRFQHSSQNGQVDQMFNLPFSDTRPYKILYVCVAASLLKVSQDNAAQINTHCQFFDYFLPSKSVPRNLTSVPCR